MDQNASTSSFLYALLSLRKKNLETDRLCRWRSIHVSASPRLRLSHLLVSVTPRSLSRLLLQGGAASNAAAAQIPSFFTIWHPLLLSCIDDVSLLVLLLASGIVTENQKNTTVTNQNTISLSLSDESKSTALSDSVDNSPQLISMVLTKRDPMVSRLTSGIVTENQKNTTVTDQNTISLSLSDESKSTALSDSVDNSPQLISMVLTKRDPMVSRLTAERRKMLEDMVG
ncbi:hypothetical protein F2Q68_00008901 [Brassica cretica]|uniref:Uncharacterized protein n=1 Tax=Brassica cretica TaxID=69181 RepID=A0A8S9KU46_BRACR|nr:hypothetical protein F2Q68_00008901 [Brassica cretica]